MNIVGFEFDRTKFPTVTSCEDWIRTNSQYDCSYLLNLKNFKLKAGYSRHMSDENRKVWNWYDVWAAKVLKIERPNAYICLIRRVGNECWGIQDIPIPLEATQEKRHKADLKKQKREINKREMAEKTKAKKRKTTADGKAEKDPAAPKKKTTRRKITKKQKEPNELSSPLGEALPELLTNAEKKELDDMVIEQNIVWANPQTWQNIPSTTSTGKTNFVPAPVFLNTSGNVISKEDSASI
jgi:hypothetical protein